MTLPRRRDGRIEWKKIDGFLDWFRKTAPSKTNYELSDAIFEKYGERLNTNQLNQLRIYYGGAMSTATKRRAIAGAVQSRTVTERLSPEKQMEAVAQKLELARLTARQTFFEMVGQKIIRAIRNMDSKLPPVTIPKRVRPKELEEEDAVLVISDVQAGLTTSSRETGGLGEFNTQVLLREIDYLGYSIETIMRYHPNVHRLHVWFNGDIVEGETIFPGQQREIDMNLVEQITFCVEHFSRLLHRFAHLFEEVRCTGTVGNHGRLGRKGEHSPMSNFDYLTYKWLEERTRGIKNISWTIPETWWLINEVQKWRFLQVHGDDTGQSTWGIPFYGMGRHANRYQEMLRLSRIQGFDYCVLGHHSEAGQFKNVICAGSWPGGTEFSIKRMQMLDVPTAPFFGVHPRFGKTWRRDIQLREPPER